jgi:predicted transcriptional regulator
MSARCEEKASEQVSKDQVRIHVSESLEDVGMRFVDAWHRMERGEDVIEKHVSFADWETMVRLLSPKRLALLRYVHQHPARNIRTLAMALGRDYRRVYGDVEALTEAGLLERDKDGVRAEYDAFDVQMRVAL